MRIHFHYHWQVPKKERYFNLFIGVWNLFLFLRGLPFCTSNGKGSLTQLTFKEYLKTYFESLRMNLAQMKKIAESIILERLKNHLKEEAIDRAEQKESIDMISIDDCLFVCFDDF